MSTAAHQQIAPVPGVDSTTRAGKRAKPLHISSLDGIRGLAFLLVFFAHTGLGFLIPGGFGVTIFFMLSGYLITTLLRLEREETGEIDFKAFYMRRTLRILPVFYIVLAGALLLNRAGYTTGSLLPMAVLSQVSHWSNYFLIAHTPESVVGGTIVLWSLAVEEHFYLLFPVVYWWTSKRLTPIAQQRTLWAGCLLCLVWRLVLIVGLHAPTVRSELGTDTRFDGLLFGALLAVTANPALDQLRWFTQERLRWLAVFGFACLLFSFSWRNQTFRYTFRYTLQGIALLPIFMYVILARGSLAFRVLNSRLMTTLGSLSYALYLVHAIFLNLFLDNFQGVRAARFISGVLALAASLFTAKLLQLTVERPLQRVRKRYSRVHA